MSVTFALDRVTPPRAVVALIALSAVSGAVAYQLGVSGFGSDLVLDLLFSFFPFMLCVVMVGWGMLQVRLSFVATIVGALSFAVFTGYVTHFIEMDTRVLRLITFTTVVAPGQAGIVALAFCAALLARWSARQQPEKAAPPTRGL